MNKPNDNDNNNTICIYFCDNHLETEKGEISLESKYNDNNIDFWPITNEIVVKENKKYKYSIFCIKMDKYNIYNFKFSTKSFLIFEKQLERFESIDVEQFEIYLNNIIKLNNNKKDLLVSTKKLFLNKKYNFSFYITVFLECLEINDMDCLRDYLYIFDLEKINKIEISTIETGKIHKVFEKLKYFGNNPETILDYDINDIRKEEITLNYML